MSYMSGSQPMGHGPKLGYWVFCLSHGLISEEKYYLKKISFIDTV